MRDPSSRKRRSWTALIAVAALLIAVTALVLRDSGPQAHRRRASNGEIAPVPATSAASETPAARRAARDGRAEASQARQRQDRPGRRDWKSYVAQFDRDGEIVERRDSHARHYRMPNGTTQALIAASPIHYRAADGSWQPISPEILAGDTGYANTTNSLKSFFPVQSDGATRIGNAEESTYSWTPQSAGYTRADGSYREVWGLRSVPAQVDEEQISYPGIFPSATDRYRIGAGTVKHDLVLDAAPPGAQEGEATFDYVGVVQLGEDMVFHTDVRQDGSFTTRGAIWVCNNSGERLFQLGLPWAAEEGGKRRVGGAYSVRPIGRLTYEMRLQIPAAWLLAADRKYPVRIDPTTVDKDGVKVDNSYFYGGLSNDYYWSSWGNTLTGDYWADGTYGGSQWYDCAVGNDYDWADELYRSAVDWDTTSIPDTATVTNTQLRIYVPSYNYSEFDGSDHYVGIWRMTYTWEQRSDEQTHWDDCGDGDKYYSFLYLYTGQGYTSWYDLGALADSRVQSQLGSNWFGVGLAPDETGDYGVLTWLDWSTLRVTYNSPPTTPSLLSPANGVRTIGNSVFFDWTTSTDAENDPITYYLYCDTGNPPSTLIYSGAASSYTWTGPVDATTYYWRVYAYDGVAWSGASSTRWFRENGLPAAPTNLSPPNNSWLTSGWKQVSWTGGGADPDSDGITYYWEVDTTDPMAAPYDASGSTTGTISAWFWTVTNTMYYWRVRAWDGYEYTSYSTQWKFGADSTQPPTPNLSSPANGAYTGSAPTLDWTDVSDFSGVTYTVQVDNDAGFGSIDRQASGLASSTWAVSPALPDGTWYWRARAVDGAGNLGAWSSVWSFTVDTIPPNQPTLASPANGTLTNDNTPTFTWTNTLPVDPAGESYQLQVDNDPAFGSPEIDVTTPLLTYTPSSALADGLYYWHVRAVDGAGNASLYTGSWTVTIDATAPVAPTLTSPSNGAYLNMQNVPLDWTHPEEPLTTYLVQVDDTSDFLTLVWWSNTGTTSSATTGALAEGLYYWRVRATDPATNVGAWSAVRTFTVDITAPSKPTNSSPLSGAWAGGNPTLDWTNSTDNLSPITYEVEVASDAGFGTIVKSASGLASSQWTVTGAPLTEGATYWWHARAVDAATNTGLWSDGTSFIVDSTPPTQVTLDSPANGTLTNDNTPTFTWNAASDLTSGVASYTIEVDNTSDFSSPEASYSGLVLTWTPSALADGLYYWHVRAVDAAGNLGAWSLTRTLTIDATPPAAPALTSPANGAFTNDTTPDLTWTDVEATATYEVQVDNDPAFGSVDRQASGLADPWWTVAPALPEGTWYWRVRATDAATNVGNWSSVRTFTVDVTPPSVPSVVSPTGGVWVNTATPTLDWSDSTDNLSPITYTVEVDDDPTFATINQSQSGVTTSSWTPAALAETTWYWRVRAIDGATNSSADSSPVGSFKVDITLPGTPTLVSPADNAIVTTSTPAFDWDDVPVDASGVTYQIQIDDGSPIAAPYVVDQSGLATSNYTPSALPDGPYWWRVRAIDGAGNIGAWSAVRKVTVDTQAPPAPILISPSNGAFTGATPILDWTDIVDATAVTYQVQVDDNSDFGSPEVNQSGLTSSNYTTASLPDGPYWWRVRASDSAGNTGPWSAVGTFTVETTGPIAPLLISPASGASVGQNVSTDWTDVTDPSGIAYYQVQIDNSGATMPSPEVDVNTSGSSYLAGPLAFGQWWWRVRAWDGAGNPGAWSSVDTFTVEGSAPSVPTLQSPANGATVSLSPVNFNWTDSTDDTGVAYYDIQVDTDSGFAAPIWFEASPSASQISVALPSTTYWWRVRAVDVNGNKSSWSGAWSFVLWTGNETSPPSVPVLVSPSNGATVPTSIVALDWLESTDNTGVASYEVEVDSSSAFTAPLVFSAAPAASEAQTPPLANGTYYWRVRAVDLFGNKSGWSGIWTFMVNVNDGAAPSVPVLLVPGNGVTMAMNPVTFDWLDSTDTGGSGVAGYTIEVDDATDFATPVASSWVVTSGASIMLPNATYWWRVRAADNAGNVSGWSEVRVFVHDTNATGDTSGPIAPNLLAPANASTVPAALATLSWQSVSDPSGIAYYDVQLDTSNPMMPPIFWTAQVASGLSVTTPVLANGTYYWQVRGVDGVGNPGAWSATWSFTINSALDTFLPSPPTLLSPANGSGLPLGPFSVPLDWTDSLDASGIAYYDVQIATDPNFPGAPAAAMTVAASAGSSAPLPNALYYWRVRAVDNAGNVGAWSAVWSFQVGTAEAGFFDFAGSDHGSGGCGASVAGTRWAYAWMALLLLVGAALIRRRSW